MLSANNFKTALSGIHPCNHILATTTLVPTVPSSPHQSNCDNVFACMTHCTTHSQETICDNMFACMTRCTTHPQGTICGNVFACMTHCMTHSQGTKCGNMFACMAHCMTHPQGTICDNVFACMTHCMTHSQGTKCGNVLPAPLTLTGNCLSCFKRSSSCLNKRTHRSLALSGLFYLMMLQKECLNPACVNEGVLRPGFHFKSGGKKCKRVVSETKATRPQSVLHPFHQVGPMFATH